jgi:3D-(3,5/4)-trihydroxycyclohexane-1,2-dione acylhydrolase (decyclizing)
VARPHPKNFHLEYGYSCMGYEIAGGLGAKMAAPEREVFVIIGDGTYLMLSSELVTAVQEGVKLIVVLLDNGGYKSIGALSRSLGQGGFGTRFIEPQRWRAGRRRPAGCRAAAIDFADERTQPGRQRHRVRNARRLRGRAPSRQSR